MALEQLVPSSRDLARRDVVMLRWPAQAALRESLSAAGIPRLLLVSRTGVAPACADELEDWVRAPLDPTELEIHAATLEQRTRRRALRPRVDDSGLIWVGHRWVDLPPAQLAVARLLLARLDRVVPAEQIQKAYLTAGGSVHPKAVKAMIGRVKRRLEEVDLLLTNVRDRGYLLEAIEHVQAPFLVQINRQE